MRNVIVLIALLGAVGGGVYLWVYKKKEVKELADSARGYPEAKTPKEAADLFVKAIKERKYDKAAKYTTGKYAELLNKGDDAARKLGEAIDNVSYQMQERSVMTDEMKIVLYGLDPFPKNITVTVDESGKEPVATIAPEGVRLAGQSTYSTWRIDHGIWSAFSGGVPPAGKVKVVKEGDAWKLDFPATAAVQTTVARLNEKHKVYVQKLEILTKEIKNEADTKENVMRRMKELLEDAAKD
jgi:hypothetical protein